MLTIAPHTSVLLSHTHSAITFTTPRINELVSSFARCVSQFILWILLSLIVYICSTLVLRLSSGTTNYYISCFAYYSCLHM